MEEKETLLDILKNPFNYEWEVQGLGMLRTYLNKDTRFQIWNKDLIVDGVTDIHTHPWDFISVILQGKITNHIYKEYPEQVNKSKKYFRCLINTGEDAYVKEKNEVYLLKCDKNTYTSGNFYIHKKHVPHKIKFKDGTITVLNKFNKNGEDKKSSEAYTYVKNGKDWVSAMPRPAKEHEIHDTIKKALVCYNNEKFEQMSSTKDVDDKEEGYFNVNISNCCDTPITAHFRRCPRCIKYL